MVGLYLTLSFCLLLGQMLHLSLVADKASDDAIAENRSFNFKKDFWKKQRFKILMAFLSGCVSLMLYSEALSMHDGLNYIQKTIFITIGFSGSGLVLRFLNRNIKRGEDTIDEMGTDKNEQTMIEYEYILEVEPDNLYKITGDTGNFDTPADFAQKTQGRISPDLKQIVWDENPFSTVDVLWPDTTVSVAGPIRKPK